MVASLELSVHSIEQLATLRRMCNQRDITARDALFVAEQLVNHGFSDSKIVLSALRSQLSGSASVFLDRLEMRLERTLQLGRLEETWSNQAVAEDLLRPEGYVFRPGDKLADKAVVIFTSKFNNFHFSNIVLDAALGELGVSRLYLKDVTSFVYFKGVKGLASNLADLPKAILDLLSAQNIRQAIVTGFSSGGYAALYSACHMPGAHYLGFSIYSDISDANRANVPKFYNDVRPYVPPSYFVDLKPLVRELMADRNIHLYFGDKEPVDCLHARRFLDLQNVRITEIPNCSHVVTSVLLERGQFQNLFSSLVEN